MADITSKELLVQTLGPVAMQNYEEAKRFYMLLGTELSRALLERVDGRLAHTWEECDGVTVQGKWEFCTQANTKNHHGNNADLTRCPGRCVQILGRPRPGWISGEEFLMRHGVGASELTRIAWEVAHLCANEARQMRLAL